jgi:hypothetical protein
MWSCCSRSGSIIPKLSGREAGTVHQQRNPRAGPAVNADVNQKRRAKLSRRGGPQQSSHYRYPRGSVLTTSPRGQTTRRRTTSRDTKPLSRSGPFLVRARVSSSFCVLSVHRDFRPL